MQTPGRRFAVRAVRAQITVSEASQVQQAYIGHEKVKIHAFGIAQLAWYESYLCSAHNDRGLPGDFRNLAGRQLPWLRRKWQNLLSLEPSPPCNWGRGDQSTNLQGTAL